MVVYKGLNEVLKQTTTYKSPLQSSTYKPVPKMLPTLGALALAVLASASPLAIPHLEARENDSPFVAPAGLNVTYQSTYNS